MHCRGDRATESVACGAAHVVASDRTRVAKSAFCSPVKPHRTIRGDLDWVQFVEPSLFRTGHSLGRALRGGHSFQDAQ